MNENEKKSNPIEEAFKNLDKDIASSIEKYNEGAKEALKEFKMKDE